MSESEFRRWKIGDVTVTRIVELINHARAEEFFRSATTREVLDIGWLQPEFANAAGELILSIHGLVVDTPTKRIMVDSCIGNDKARVWPNMDHLQTGFLDDLERAGFARESFDAVLCTHLHVDHVGWNTRLVDGRWVATFANARYLFGRAEYQHWATHQDDPAHPPVSFLDSVQPIVDAGRADLIGHDHRVCEELTLIPTPGHSPGHLSILIRSEGEEMLLAGDAAHHPAQMTHLDWSSTADHDPAQAAETRRALFARFADTPTRVIGGHFSAGRIVRDGDAFRMKV